MPRGITENDVWTACDALLLAGARPTIERVRQKIGSGSPNTVSLHLDSWFKGLGGRIKDPAGFSAPPELPDPIQQAAKHFWEVALAETRRDFDLRLEKGLTAAVMSVESERQNAEQASVKAIEAANRVSQLEDQLADQGGRLDQSLQELSAEQARIDEVRLALAMAHERLDRQDERSLSEQAELHRQLVAAVDRADAADRRVAMELERERTSRAKAERHSEALQKSADGLRDRNATAQEQTRRQLDSTRESEANLRTQHAILVAELTLEKNRTGDLLAIAETSSADVSTVRAQVASLQASFDRLAALVKTGSGGATHAQEHVVKQTPRRAAKAKVSRAAPKSTVPRFDR